MRIIVNDIAASTGGAMTVLREFYEAVKTYDKKNTWIFLLSDKYVEPCDNIKILLFPDVKKSHVKKLVFDYFTGKRILQSLNADVIFSLQNTYTYGIQIPQIIYLHQAIPFQDVKKFSFFKPHELRYAVYQYLIGSIIKKSVEKADRVIVQTNWFKEAVFRKCNINKDVIKKISPTISDFKADNNLSFDKKNFFYPTSDYPYKNNNVVLKAAEILNNDSLGFNIEMTLNGKSRTKNVDYIGNVEHQEIMNKYNSGTLIFPSCIETFGYPLAEAKMAGAIVLASDCAFSHEILDGYENVYFFMPQDFKALAGLMSRVINGEITKNPVFHEADKHNGWEDVIKEIINVKGVVSDKYPVSLQS